MSVLTSQGLETQHQHFVDSDYNKLLAIQRDAKFKGQSCSEIMPISPCQSLWKLTIETPKP